jgi:translation initiation factor IF-3
VSRFFNGKKNDDTHEKYSVNEAIRADKVLVIDGEGNNLGLMDKQEALDVATGRQLDLVQVGTKGENVVARIIDFGKFLYMKKKQLGEAKKGQKIICIKEVKMRPNIGDQDYRTKLNHAIQFFQEGKKVKFTIQFRGREIGMMGNVGTKIFERITSDLEASEVGALVHEKENRGFAFWSKVYSVKS